MRSLVLAGRQQDSTCYRWSARDGGAYEDVCTRLGADVLRVAGDLWANTRQAAAHPNPSQGGGVVPCAPRPHRAAGPQRVERLHANAASTYVHADHHAGQQPDASLHRCQPIRYQWSRAWDPCSHGQAGPPRRARVRWRSQRLGRCRHPSCLLHDTAPAAGGGPCEDVRRQPH